MKRQKIDPKANEIKAIIDPVAIGQLVSQACRSFELLERFHDGSVTLSPSYSEQEGYEDLKITCERALVTDFVFLVARLHRLCENFEQAVSLAFPADAIRTFRDAVKPIRDKVRNAIEHALEPGASVKNDPLGFDMGSVGCSAAIRTLATIEQVR